MNLENILDRMHGLAIQNVWLRLFTVFTRVLLALGFIPPGLKKIMGIPFANLPDSNPVGHYFNALYQTGFYYEFIGWAQVIAAVLLLFPRTAFVGAMMFLPIILNIAILTNSVGFVGTWLITDLMLLASVYLLAWDYDRLKPLFFSTRHESNPVKSPRLVYVGLPLLFALGGASLACFFAYAHVANIHRAFVPVLTYATIGGTIFGAVMAVHFKFMKFGRLTASLE